MVEHILHAVCAERERAAASDERRSRRSARRRSKWSARSSSRCSSSSRPTSRCSRWSASSGACSRRWRSPSASRCSAPCCLRLTLIPVLRHLPVPHGRARAWGNPVLDWLYRSLRARGAMDAAVTRARDHGRGRRRGRRGARSGSARASAPSSCRSSTKASSGSAPTCRPASRSRSPRRWPRTIRALIRQSPEVQMVRSQTGRNDSGTDPFGPNRNEFLVASEVLRDLAAWQDEGDLVDELSQRLRGRDPGRLVQLHAADHRHVDRDRDRLVRRSRGHHQRARPRQLRALATQALDGAAADPRARPTPRSSRRPTRRSCASR